MEGDSQFELPGAIESSAAEQSFVFPIEYLPDVAIKSFTVYDYANRIAMGSAALD